MLRGVRVDDSKSLVEIVDEDDTGLLAGERSANAVDVLGRRHLRAELSVDRVGECLTVGDEDARGQRVVLGLAEQVGCDVDRVGLSSARTTISVGPASASMPTIPRRSRFAAATYTFPGPVTRSTGRHSDPLASSRTP